MKNNANKVDQDKENKQFTSINELTDCGSGENIKHSEVYEKYGQKREKSKQLKGINQITSDRYKNQYIHYIIKNEYDLEKFENMKNKDYK